MTFCRGSFNAGHLPVDAIFQRSINQRLGDLVELMLWTDGKMGNPSSAGQMTMRVDHYCPDQCASHAIRFQIVNHDLFFVKNVIVALNIRRIGQMEWLMCFGNPAICYRILRLNDTNNKSMRRYVRGNYLRLPIRCLC